jgi:hypothetical protein
MADISRTYNMTLEQASLISQVISAVAILASLIFLGIQVRGNTRALRSQSYFNGLTHGQRPFELVIQDPTLMKLVNIGYTCSRKLSSDEMERFHLHTFMLFNAWEYFFYQAQDGSIPRQLFSGTDAHMKRLVATKPGIENFWREYQHAYDEPFLSYVSTIFMETPRSVVL